ncbi:MAG: hypothetical protein R6V05_14530 [Candidatus Brocadiia bacterium]
MPAPSRTDVAALIEDLTRHCATLRESLAALARVPAHEVEDSLEEHLRVIRPLFQRIESLAERVAERRDDVAGRPTAERAELLDQLAACTDTLQRAGRRYGELADHVQDVRDMVGARLREVRRGGRTLRGYRRGMSGAG